MILCGFHRFSIRFLILISKAIEGRGERCFSQTILFGHFQPVVSSIDNNDIAMLSSVLSLGNEVPKRDKCAARFQSGLPY